ncbi:keratin-like protein KRT222 [Chanos chanos]|uniref:Keratin-like protein KRT222 n=1 Tax=Chanos chanos TaxID=29144 RepID=A0A6J2VXB0_CHACN|nr:keratin-like protein KRT222 [Chanos chanos]
MAEEWISPSCSTASAPSETIRAQPGATEVQQQSVIQPQALTPPKNRGLVAQLHRVEQQQQQHLYHRYAQQETSRVWAQVKHGEAALREARAELTEARKQWQSLQVEIESLRALEKGLESSLSQNKQQYACQLQDLSRTVEGLEAELQEVRNSLANQRQRHQQVLNTKMRLEYEITTYRKLLEREEGRFFGYDGQTPKLKPWSRPVMALEQNGIANGTDDLEEVLPLSESHSTVNKTRRSPAVLRRQRSLVILTEPVKNSEGKIATIKTQEIFQGNIVRESAEGHGTVETEKVDQVIKQWEGSFFQGNPKLRKKSVSLRFDLHMAVADEGCGQTKQDSLPDVEVRLVMKRSRSIPTIAQ